MTFLKVRPKLKKKKKKRLSGKPWTDGPSARDPGGHPGPPTSCLPIHEVTHGRSASPTRIYSSHTSGGIPESLAPASTQVAHRPAPASIPESLAPTGTQVAQRPASASPARTHSSHTSGGGSRRRRTRRGRMRSPLPRVATWLRSARDSGARA